LDCPKDKPKAFLELLLPCQRVLEVYCRRLLRDPTLVEEVLQDAVTAAFARFDHFAEGSNFRAWIFRFVTFAALNRNRKQEPVAWGREVPFDVVAQPEVLELLPDNVDGLMEHFDDQVAAALRALPAAERTVLLLRAVGELSYKEIHELLSMPLGSVVGYLSRARQKLRRALADYAARQGHSRRPAPGEARP